MCVILSLIYSKYNYSLFYYLNNQENIHNLHFKKFKEIKILNILFVFLFILSHNIEYLKIYTGKFKLWQIWNFPQQNSSSTNQRYFPATKFLQVGKFLFITFDGLTNITLEKWEKEKVR